MLAQHSYCSLIDEGFKATYVYIHMQNVRIISAVAALFHPPIHTMHALEYSIHNL